MKLIQRIKQELAFLKLLNLAVPVIIAKHWRRYWHKRAASRGTPVLVTIGYDAGKRKSERFYCSAAEVKYPDIGTETERGVVTSVDVQFQP